ncbi:tetraacyldisaccharide 4'-kinase [Myroides odoratimimus]|uniref:Tetraacyldisaccharide 4'-kinase n=1 Tax=Myroides odoratimimus CIP 101113 TaxID=883154 RepID=A0AAV3F4X1_9FLAO|nr:MULTISPECIES: tetraacyldisaccharide 4'-kinase [Myroides]AJA69323.1 lipid-A-disaccharide kinase [Myroides sp. A21]EHO12981.1 tetraacyldisaccharide 4'-kinase [Myroides odoratimimus CCUG 12901]EHO13599.1 tetraacyldisaccharide 4'-kinase [Myroides odoratimimus CIP 101113]EKB03320.1 tetraacyldisaccharide 4'-kinase [Myroides odoratimimus CCUG 3837]EPH11309.1 tetraacyldisaccharide 4'-kinase [Myroides odoratimimus CCUG 12700]
MELLRKLLFPFAILYGGITSLRNYLYSINILKRTSFSTPTIVVGNLSVGGTGKTPMVEYIIRLLKDKYKIATLSRGYKRKSEGFFLADEHTTMEQIGDEPFQYHHKFDNIAVAVDAKRVNGIENILKRRTDTQAIVLDDAFQHLAVKGGFNILLTTYDEPYYSDYMLPTGNLRESRRGAKRADIIIVTKCPPTLSSTEQNSIVKKLNLKLGQLSFFTYIEFSKLAYSKADSISVEDLKKEEFLMVAGIAKPQSFFDHLKGDKTICLTFPDHHHFSSTDIELILNKAKESKIITTEKDYVRLNGLIPSNKLYYLPIQTSFLNNQEEFDKTILNYVGASTRNG